MRLFRIDYGVFEELDGWVRRKLRCLIWRRWKRVYTRARRLISLGFAEAKAWCCACNGVKNTVLFRTGLHLR